MSASAWRIIYLGILLTDITFGFTNFLLRTCPILVAKLNGLKVFTKGHILSYIKWVTKGTDEIYILLISDLQVYPGTFRSSLNIRISGN